MQPLGLHTFVVVGRCQAVNQQDATMCYNLLLQHLLIAQHVSSDTLLIIRSSKTVIAVSGFTYVCGCRSLSSCQPTRCDHVLEFITPTLINCSTCIERHTDHHQELKNCNCSLCLYIRLWLPAAVKRPATKHVRKTRSCNYSF